MFSLIALYFEYRKLQTQRAASPVAGAPTRTATVANDVSVRRAISAAA